MKTLTKIKLISLAIVFLSQNETLAILRCEEVFRPLEQNPSLTAIHTRNPQIIHEMVDVLNSKSTMWSYAIGRKVKFVSQNKERIGILKQVDFGEIDWNQAPPKPETFVTVIDERNNILLSNVSLRNLQSFMVERSTFTFGVNADDLELIFPLIKQEFYSRHEALNFQKSSVRELIEAVNRDDSGRWQKFMPGDSVRDTVATPDPRVIENFKKMLGRQVIGIQAQSGVPFGGANEVISFAGKITDIINFSKNPDQWPFWKIKVQGPLGTTWIDASGPRAPEDIYFIKAE